MMPRAPLLLAASGLLAALAAPAASAQAPAGEPSCAETLALRVQRHYDAVRDLSADFTQSARMASLGGADADAVRTGGKVVFAKPGRMRWSYEEPEESLVVTDGKTLWTWDPGLGEAQRVTVGSGFLSGAAIQFLLGEGEVLESFAVAADRCEGERVTLQLTPLDPSTYERLALEVDPASGAVQASEVVDLFGNTTRVEFSNVRTNTDPKPGIFRFEPPADARVIELAPPR